MLRHFIISNASWKIVSLAVISFIYLKAFVYLHFFIYFCARALCNIFEPLS